MFVQLWLKVYPRCAHLMELHFHLTPHLLCWLWRCVCLRIYLCGVHLYVFAYFVCLYLGVQLCVPSHVHERDGEWYSESKIWRLFNWLSREWRGCSLMNGTFLLIALLHLFHSAPSSLSQNLKCDIFFKLDIGSFFFRFLHSLFQAFINYLSISSKDQFCSFAAIMTFISLFLQKDYYWYFWVSQLLCFFLSTYSQSLSLSHTLVILLCLSIYISSFCYLMPYSFLHFFLILTSNNVFLYIIL